MRNKRLNNKKCAPHRMHHHAPNRREACIANVITILKKAKNLIHFLMYLIFE